MSWTQDYQEGDLVAIASRSGDQVAINVQVPNFDVDLGSVNRTTAQKIVVKTDDGRLVDITRADQIRKRLPTDGAGA